MSQAIAQSATQLAVSTPKTEWDFYAAAVRCASRATKQNSMIRERMQLNRTKLVSAVCAEYRSHHSAEFGVSSRLPADLFAKVETAVDSVINAAIAQVHVGNVVSYRRQFVFKANTLSYQSRTTVIGEDIITLKEQAFAATLEINALERKLTAQQQKPTPDLDKEKAIKEQIQKREMARILIQDSLAKLESK